MAVLALAVVVLTHAMLEPGQILDVAAARLQALDASKWAQGDRATPAWRESSIALDVAQESAFGHLAFSVAFDDAPFEAGRYNQFEGATVRARLLVGFLYRLRAMAQVADHRNAWNAARQTMGCLASDWSIAVNGQPGTVLDHVNTSPENLGRAAFAADASWIAIRQSLIVTFDLSLIGA